MIPFPSEDGRAEINARLFRVVAKNDRGRKLESGFEEAGNTRLRNGMRFPIPKRLAGALEGSGREETW